ncbi:MAG: DUF721 domain-containing protein [Hyphomicrobiaceae bacterium]
MAIAQDHRNRFPRRSGDRARAVGAFLPELTKKAFQKYGFSTATLLTDWREVVGSELATYTRPERLKWQRAGVPVLAPDESGEQQRGATLVLRVESARALDVQYQTDQIKSRINAYFGYYAVGQIRLIQAPVAPLDRKGAHQEVVRSLARAKPASHDGSLAAALDRLGECVKADTLTRRKAMSSGPKTP